MFGRFWLALVLILAAGIAAADPLPSWSETDARARIIDFVEAVTDPSGPDYVTPEERVAVFDNDGTLWSEQPAYFQLFFAIHATQKAAEADPGFANTDALKAAADGDAAKLVEMGESAIIEVITATHASLTVEDFQESVAEWIAADRHPETGLAFTDMTYQPMVELLSYLRDNGFKTYIVSGGGLHFMRVFTDEAYGIPPEQVLGTYTETSYAVVDGEPVISKDPAIAFVDDKEGKPLNIERTLGRRPIFAAGNSDGDFAMIEWTTAGDGPRFGMIVHHTDDEREVAYDCDSHIGKLCDGLEKGPDLGWLIVDMATDWDRIYTGAR